MREEAKEAQAACGPVILIGGHEDKKGERAILREVARRAGAGPLVITTLASRVGSALWEDYERVFRDLGVEELSHLEIERRGDAYDAGKLEVLKGARCVFFTGGDQLRITSNIGGTPVYDALLEVHRRGGLMAGTSAGASVMSETMVVSGPGEESPKVRDALRMAPGLGLVRDVIIDQHFAQRGRLGRLLGAVAQNPRILGVGIDEDTAVVMEDERSFHVLGSGAVYVADGHEISFTNLSEGRADEVVSMFNLRLHVLSDGDRFDLASRRPSAT